MGSPYRQFCPVAKAMELLDERWTLLVVRELMLGSRHFNELRRGVPRMSPTLLSKRLGQLTRAGLVERTPEGGEVRYTLTPAGEELRGVVEAIGAWGTRWVPALADADLDPRLLLWDMHRGVDHAAVRASLAGAGPPEVRTERAVVRFRFPDAPASSRDWWLVLTGDEADVCDHDPGHPVDVTVSTSLRRMVEIWRGDVTWTAALRSGSVELAGRRDLCRALPGWLLLSPFATVPRPVG